MKFTFTDLWRIIVQLKKKKICFPFCFMISGYKEDPRICHLLGDILDLCYSRTDWPDLPDMHPKGHACPAALKTKQ